MTYDITKKKLPSLIYKSKTIVRKVEDILKEDSGRLTKILQEELTIKCPFELEQYEGMYKISSYNEQPRSNLLSQKDEFNYFKQYIKTKGNAENK